MFLQVEISSLSWKGLGKKDIEKTLLPRAMTFGHRDNQSKVIPLRECQEFLSSSSSYPSRVSIGWSHRKPESKGNIKGILSTHQEDKTADVQDSRNLMHLGKAP
jgi:hypothetical protein